MRSSAQPLPRNRREGRRTPVRLLPNRPVQLPLFGEATPSLPERPRLLPGPDAHRLQLLRRLNRFASGRLCDLKLTDNRRTILTVRPAPAADRSRLELRIHHSFLEAPEEVLRAVADFVGSKKGSDRAREALTLIREHFSQHKSGAARVRRAVLRPEGSVPRPARARGRPQWPLLRGAPDRGCHLGGRGGRGACRRGRTSSLQLGSYSYEDNLIRLHRVLDDPGVPRYVVEAVVHHELLHADMPPEIRNGAASSTRPSSARGSASSGSWAAPTPGSRNTCPSCCGRGGKPSGGPASGRRGGGLIPSSSSPTSAARRSTSSASSSSPAEPPVLSSSWATRTMPSVRRALADRTIDLTRADRTLFFKVGYALVL